ncbi:MAG: WD40/YVTN/BNR-like repeat-containing protein [Bacteroidota bacterium]
MRRLLLCLMLVNFNFSFAQSWKSVNFMFEPSSNINYKIGLIDFKTLYLHPTKKNIRYLLSSKGGLYISKDGGVTWILCKGSNQLPACELTSIVADSYNENILYLGTNNNNNCGGLWKSNNGGNTFVLLQNFFHSVNEISISPVNRYLLHIATTDGLYKSLNGGVTLSKINSVPSINFFHLKRNTNMSSHYVYATSNTNFYFSSDEGTTWNTSLSINTALCHEIGLISADSNCIYLFNGNHNGEVYASFNKGISFSIIKTDSVPSLNGINLSDTLNNSLNNGFILPEITNSTSFYSGSKIILNYTYFTGFTPIIQYQKQLPILIHEIKYSDVGDTLFACTSGGLYSSWDNGITWNYVMNGVQNLEGVSMNLAEQDWKIFTANNGIFELIDDTLKSTNSGIVSLADSIFQDVVDTNLWFKISNAHSIFYKNKANTSWVNLSTGLPTRCKISDIKVDFHKLPNCLVALTEGCGIYSLSIDSLRSLKANFDVSPHYFCKNDRITISDKSVGKPDSIHWEINGAAIISSNNNQLTIQLNNLQQFSVKLIAYKNNLSDTCISNKKSFYSNQLYKIDSANYLGNFFSDSIIHSSNSNFQWIVTYTDSIHTNAYAFPNFNVNATGNNETLLSSIFILPDSTNATLRFDYAYANYSREYSDTLIIKVHLLCLNKEIILFQKGGSELRTINDSLTIPFIPNANEWRNDSLDLGSCVGAGPMQIIIENKGHYGNNLYLDNLQIDSNYFPATFQINVNFFIEGYYCGQQRMRPALYNAGISNNEDETDSFRLQLLDKIDPTIVKYEVAGIVKTDGTSRVNIPINYCSDSYYLGLITRNGISVYTQAPVYLSRWGYQEWELRW